MTTAPLMSDRIRAYALKQVGAAYIMGATAEPCTPKYRRALASGRSSDYADRIIDNCPVLSGKQSNCEGCQWQDRLAYDCAQLTLHAAEAAGLFLPSGATSQWNKADWLAKGTIDLLPRDHVAFLYRQREGESKMRHTGVYLGDGTVVDARGHDDGVRHDALENFPWTHFGILKGMPCPDELAANSKRPTLRQGSKGESVRELQRLLRTLGFILEADGKYGPITVQCVKSFQGTAGLTRDGVVGPLTWAALDASAKGPRYTVTITGLIKTVALDLTSQYGGTMTAEGGETDV